MVFNKRINNSLIISYVVKDDDDWQTTFPCWTGRTFESWVCPKAESRLRRGGRTRPSLLTGEKKDLGEPWYKKTVKKGDNVTFF